MQLSIRTMSSTSRRCRDAHAGAREAKGHSALPDLLEAYTMVRRRLGRTSASDWITDMADAALINPTPEDYRQAIARIGALADQPITLFDATVAVLATRLRLDVWTYDHHFDVMRVPGLALISYFPSQK